MNKNHRRIKAFKYRIKKQFVDINLYYLLVWVLFITQQINNITPTLRLMTERGLGQVKSKN